MLINPARFILRALAAPIRCGQMQMQLRFQSSRRMLEEPGSVCCKAGSAEVCKSVTKSKAPPKKTLGPAKKPKLTCIDNPCCPDPETTYDEDFAHLLKHKKRTNYQQTWNECPPRRIVQKVVCGEPIPEPKCEIIEKKKTPSPAEECKKQDSKCPKIRMPGCRPPDGRKLCKKLPSPSNCEKIKCPYPAYSECQRPHPKPLRPVECNCLRMRGMCEVYKMFKAKGKLKIKKR